MRSQTTGPLPPEDSRFKATQPRSLTTDQPAPAAKAVSCPIQKRIRKRNKAHLAFVASQPCLVCRRTPCDAHHLKFAEPRSLGRKVSDEFTVPLCREHQELHREIAW